MKVKDLIEALKKRSGDDEVLSSYDEMLQHIERDLDWLVRGFNGPNSASNNMCADRIRTAISELFEAEQIKKKAE